MKLNKRFLPFYVERQIRAYKELAFFFAVLSIIYIVDALVEDSEIYFFVGLFFLLSYIVTICCILMIKEKNTIEQKKIKEMIDSIGKD